jgi:hypothetical protein
MSTDGRGRLAFMFATALLAAACSMTPSPSGSATPSGSASATSSATPQGSVAPSARTAAPPSAAGWLAARVEQPVEIEGQPTDAPAFCSPCHPIVGTYINALVAVHGGYLALGHEQPPSQAAAWSSADATTWRRAASLPAPEGSSIQAAIATPDAGIVAVGTNGRAAAVWSSADGVAWTMKSLPAPMGVGAIELLAAVAGTSGGYVAAGYVETAAAVRSATFWRSSDGVVWSRATAPLPAGPSEVTGLAALAGGTTVVAVGISGDERRGSAAAWRSVDAGLSWQAVSSPSLAGGRMLAVAAGQSGFAAVGETSLQTGAAAWASVDGSTWAAAPAQPALDNGGLQMVMTAAAGDGSGFVASGWKTDAGNGSAVVWHSSDASAWIRYPQDVSFSGAGMAAVMAVPRFLAAGTMGWPDTHAAEVWIAPPR